LEDIYNIYSATPVTLSSPAMSLLHTTGLYVGTLAAPENRKLLANLKTSFNDTSSKQSQILLCPWSSIYKYWFTNVCTYM